ncbi:MoaD/ThiS family protein [Nakamurella deserti]|uniref:MoaD/ThiS family protein n=1 Tax=Nakamurella deserti TaxID=2164074 RepID=UPI000DBE47AE|nr:MoaD/ThiS family protein [Nakamurella deserti]
MTGSDDTVTLTVRYFAAAAAAAGVEEERVDAAAPATVRSVLDSCVRRFGPEFATVLQRCSYLLDEIAVHELDAPLRSGARLDVLPPFAGG